MRRLKLFFLIIAFISLLQLIECFTTKDNDDDAASTDSSDELAEKFLQMVKNLSAEKKKLKSDKEKLKNSKTKQQTEINKNDVIRLNVGGQIMMTTRTSLIHVPFSTFALLFNGRWEDRLTADLDGNAFLDFDPSLFSHLLEQLRKLERHDKPNFSPPNPSSIDVQQSFQRMLKKLGLDSHLASVNNLAVVMDVGGQSIMTRQRKLNSLKLIELLSRSAISKHRFRLRESRIFVDADPKLFQHLIKQINDEEPTMQNTVFQTPPNRQGSAFNRMLNMLGFSVLTTTTTTTSTSTISPFSQCSSYKAIQDETRLVDHVRNGASLCDKSEFTDNIQWVRFLSPGGTQLATSAPEPNGCGTSATGWYNGTMPQPGTTETGIVCYHWDDDPCKWENMIEVTNCGPFYVFGLTKPPHCYLRYCTSES